MNNWYRYGRYALLTVLFVLFGVSYGLLQTVEFGQECAAGEAGAKGKHPRLVQIIRHGEKANDENDIHLNSRGAARAAALPSLFVIPPTFPTKPAPFATPDFLYATKATKHSNRPVETITPLARALGDMKIHDKHKDDDYQAVVDAIFGDENHVGKTVLISWHHGKIPELALAVAHKAKNGDKLKNQIPNRWEGAVFDRVWQFTFADNGNATFANQPQQLLFGDAKK